MMEIRSSRPGRGPSRKRIVNHRSTAPLRRPGQPDTATGHQPDDVVTRFRRPAALTRPRVKTRHRLVRASGHGGPPLASGIEEFGVQSQLAVVLAPRHSNRSRVAGCGGRPRTTAAVAAGDDADEVWIAMDELATGLARCQVARVKMATPTPSAAASGSRWPRIWSCSL